jgi:hypothetical protein
VLNAKCVDNEGKEITKRGWLKFRPFKSIWLVYNYLQTRNLLTIYKLRKLCSKSPRNCELRGQDRCLPIWNPTKLEKQQVISWHCGLSFHYSPTPSAKYLARASIHTWLLLDILQIFFLQSLVTYTTKSYHYTTM